MLVGVRGGWDLVIELGDNQTVSASELLKWTPFVRQPEPRFKRRSSSQCDNTLGVGGRDRHSATHSGQKVWRTRGLIPYLELLQLKADRFHRRRLYAQFANAITTYIRAQSLHNLGIFTGLVWAYSRGG